MAYHQENYKGIVGFGEVCVAHAVRENADVCTYKM